LIIILIKSDISYNPFSVQLLKINFLVWHSLVSMLIIVCSAWIILSIYWFSLGI